MKKILPNFIFMAIFIFAVAIYINYDTRKSKKIINALKKEYPSIGFEERINAKITGIYNVDPKISRNDSYQVFLVLDNSIKKDIHASLELIQKLMIDQVIEVGDQLVKESNSYSFFLYKLKASDTLKYEFELCDDFRYPLKRSKNQ